jgi:NADPH:quinone reductase-like Zn-dependent oxidoreductase
MKALRYTPSLPRFFGARLLGKRFPKGLLSLRLEAVPLPERAGFQRVRVLLAGVCGSDLALLYGKSPPTISPFFSFPAVLGHEILGEVEGEKVAVNPLLACADRGLPPCPMCQKGEEGLCQNVAEGGLAPGMLGYNKDLPGGWGEWVLAHKERLYPIPQGVPDERAVLAEPLAVVLRGLGKSRPWPEEVLILGMGTIGLMAVRLLRALGYLGRPGGLPLGSGGLGEREGLPRGPRPGRGGGKGPSPGGPGPGVGRSFPLLVQGGGRPLKASHLKAVR